MIETRISAQFRCESFLIGEDEQTRHYPGKNDHEIMTENVLRLARRCKQEGLDGF